MRKPSHSASNGQETPLEGFDIQSSVGQDSTPRVTAQTPKLSIVLGVCCRCKERPAVLKSPVINTITSPELWVYASRVKTGDDMRQRLKQELASLHGLCTLPLVSEGEVVSTELGGVAAQSSRQ